MDMRPLFVVVLVMIKELLLPSHPSEAALLSLLLSPRRSLLRSFV